ncbi:MAG: DUF3105 domain-containing protein [Firmicutes bacterium]|nr:DUF3105 domain-containing protein [Bacillota bacterium]
MGKNNKLQRQAKQKRREQRRAKQQRARRLTTIIGSAALLLVLGVTGYFLFAGRDANPGETGSTADDEPYLWTTRPPHSGTHEEVFLDRNIFEEPVPEKIQVHALEPHAPTAHEGSDPEKAKGGVFIQYSCRDCTELVDQLKPFVERYAPRVYLAPYYKMDRKIALTAWERIEFLDDINEETITRFIETNLRDFKKPGQG